ncbi:helix-turn-helix domain-containing protein [Nonlabens agnitus]|uniref:Transcriptional regulator n=1 Tax=Nonlabens agnitus TaxID=870484 RepID=A0A2S9WVW1_9FLAO|nr:helix-turn-helix transcriptional regulator [Nonlabens agnitus]PRP67608.1 transcriptional regulator [Nonlabens agnitus]
MSFFGKNIKKIRGVKGLSQQAFADMFDLKRGTLGAYEEGRSEPKIETIITIANYFSISIDDMLTAELTVNQLLRFNDQLTVSPEELEREKFASVPCITPNNAGDYLEYSLNEQFMQDMPQLQLPINLDKKFIAYTVDSLEMTSRDEGLFPKDIVIAEFVPANVVSKLNAGTMVLVVTADQFILRRMYLTGKKLTLRADHNKIEDMTLELSQVKQVWRARYVFYRRLPEIANDISSKMNALQQQMEELRKLTS